MPLNISASWPLSHDELKQEENEDGYEKKKVT